MTITNTTNITLEHLINLTNMTNLPETYININEAIYGGWLFFILLWVLGAIIFVRMQGREDQPVNNAMYMFLFLSIISLFWRGVVAIYMGTTYALVSDYQMYIFPLMLGATIFMSYATRPT